MTPYWISAFLDVPREHHPATVAFWAAVTATTPSPTRGEHDEFLTLVPPAGDDFLRVQRTDDGAPGIHLDLHVHDLDAATAHAVAHGARVLATPGHVVLASPGGLTFCLVTHPAGERGPAPSWPDGQTSLVDQVCIDVPRSGHDREVEFWRAVTGFTLEAGSAHDEFLHLRAPAEQPLQLLVQRLDETDGPARAHLDLGTSSGGREREVARHESLGAVRRGEGRGWTVLADPSGAVYCVTDHEVR